MFDSRNRIHSWLRNLNLFISEPWRGAAKNVSMVASKTPNTLTTPKLELRNLQANQSRLGPSLLLKGEITGSEDLVIDGTVEGIVRLNEGKLMIGPAANVKADITAGEVVVSGNLKGNIFARGRIEIRNDGSVTGDLTTPQVFIEDGALFKGSIEIEKNNEKEAILFEKESGPAKVTAATAGSSHV